MGLALAATPTTEPAVSAEVESAARPPAALPSRMKLSAHIQKDPAGGYRVRVLRQRPMENQAEPGQISARIRKGADGEYGVRIAQDVPAREDFKGPFSTRVQKRSDERYDVSITTVHSARSAAVV